MMIESALRFGHVTEYDPSRHMARVNFPDLGITSYWLPVLVSNTLKNHDEVHLDIGEHVACMMNGEAGVILGAFYDDKNKPVVQDADIRAVTFDDGVRVMYDREAHSLLIDSPELISVDGERINLNAGTMGLTAEGIAVSGETTLSGNITLSGDITLSGNVSCPGYCHCGG